MKLVIGVHFDGAAAVAVGLAFDEWDAPNASRTWVSHIAAVEKTERGALDLRALPCYMQLLREHQLAADVIVMDGLVHLDALETPALGRHLYHALGARSAIIGVSKTAMAQTPAQFEVVREAETRPLVVTCVGIDLGAAKARLRAMHGKRRVPTLLKLAARIAKGNSTR